MHSACIRSLNSRKICFIFFQFQCFPLYSLLLAMGNPTVNLFILDIEGSEYQVLKTIPWDKVDIEVLAYQSWRYIDLYVIVH